MFSFDFTVLVFHFQTMSMSGKTTVFLRSNHTGHFLLHHRSGYISCVLLSLVVLLFILTTNGVQIQEQDDETSEYHGNVLCRRVMGSQLCYCLSGHRQAKIVLPLF